MDLNNGLVQHLFEQGFERLHTWASSLPPALQESLQEFEVAWHKRIKRPEQVFLSPMGTPAFPLLAWASESVLQPDEGVAELAAEAMATLYYAVRIQDDIVDEDLSKRCIYLEQVLEARALLLLGEIAEDSETMLREWCRIAISFNEAAVVDAELRSSATTEWDDDAVALQGRKFLPMVAPLSAIFIRAGLADRLDWLRDTVEHLSVALQLTNDIAGVRHDLETAQHSPYIAALGLVPGRHSEADLLPGLRRSMRTGERTRFINRVSEALDRAAESFAELPFSRRMLDHIAYYHGALGRLHRRSALRALSHARPLLADLEITQRCNLRCSACFVTAQQGESCDPPELSVELVREIMEELSGYSTTLHLTGGEPFVHPGIWTILSEAKVLGLDRVIINTNGTALPDKQLARLGAVQPGTRLLVSVDGPPGAHERSRGVGVEGKALTVLREAPRHNVDATPATIMTKELVEYGISAWRDWLGEQIGGEHRHLTLWPLFLRPEAPTRSDQVGHALSDSDMTQAAIEVAELIRSGADVAIVDGPTFNPLLERLGVPKKKLRPCNAARGRLCVLADGTVSPCHPFMLPMGRVELGAVAGFVSRFNANPVARRFVTADHELCRSCEDRTICGSCQGVIVGRGGELHSNDGSCRHLVECSGVEAEEACCL